MSLSCSIVQDMLPIYLEKAVSEESERLIEEHLKECEACRHMLAACKIRFRKKYKDRKRLTPNMLIEDSLLKQVKAQAATLQITALLYGALMGFYVLLTAGTWWLMSLIYAVVGLTGKILTKRSWPAPLFALATTLIYSGLVNPVDIPTILLQILVNLALAFGGGILAFFIGGNKNPKITPAQS
jgi:predicted anti-sigma-YlaC factor YlaD